MRCYKEQNATKLKAEGEKTRNNKEATKEKEHKHRGNAQPKKIESIKSEEIIIPQSETIEIKTRANPPCKEVKNIVKTCPHVSLP